MTTKGAVNTILHPASLDALPAPAGAGNPPPQKIDKPWGYELLWARTSHYAAKILHIEAGHRLSLQYHRVKEETLMLARGCLVLELEDSRGTLERHQAVPGQVFLIPPGRRHRLMALEPCDVLEVSTPELADVVRLEDDYGRVLSETDAESPVATDGLA